MRDDTERNAANVIAARCRADDQVRRSKRLEAWAKRANAEAERIWLAAGNRTITRYRF